MVISLAPAVADKCANKQEQGRLGLVEVCNHARNYAVCVAGCDDDASAGHECVFASLFEPRSEGFESVGGADVVGIGFVRRPLRYFAVPTSGGNEPTGMVEALEGADRGCAYCVNRFVVYVDCKVADEVQRHRNEFAVHIVVTDAFAFDGAESACADVERDFADIDAFSPDFIHEFRGEMQTGGRCSYRAVDMAVYGLIIFGISFLGGAV